MGKFRPKKSKLSSLAENWYTECLDDVNSYSDIIFLSFEPKILFWTNLDRKSQSCLFWLKTGIHGISRMLILIPTTVFWIANPRSTFGQIWAEKVKAVCLPENWYTLTCTHSISKMLILISILVILNFKPKSWGCWFLSWD